MKNGDSLLRETDIGFGPYFKFTKNFYDVLKTDISIR